MVSPASMEWYQALFPLAAYLIGSFPSGVVLSRSRYRLDVREMGSGNIGATNVTRNFGLGAGVLTFVLDFSKGAFSVAVAIGLCPHCPWLIALVALGAVLGHCYSVFLKFEGGKGVATTLGCLAVTLPWAALLMAVLYVLGISFSRISAVGSLLGITSAVVYVSAMPVPPAARVQVFGMALIVLLRHRPNIRRLVA